MVENFFKRTRFRRSRRLRSSFRTSLIKKSPTAAGSTGATAASPAVAVKRIAVDRPSDTTKDASAAAAVVGTVRVESKAVGGKADVVPGVYQCYSPGTCRSTVATDDTSTAAQGKCRMESGASSDAVGQCVVSNGVTTLGSPADCHADVESLHAELAALRNELSKKQDLLVKMQDRERQLRERLSEQAQRQLERGASKFEDISLGENRPTQLVKRYGNLYNEARLDAMDALDELSDMADADDLKVKLLLSIVVLAFRSAQKTLVETKAKIRELLHIPEVLRGGNTVFTHLVQELEDTVSIYLRKTVEKHSVTKSYEEVCERVWETLYDYPSLRTCAGLLHYVDECVRLAWALTLQNPPLIVDYESRHFDPSLHVRFHTSDPDSTEIKCVLWPMLTEGDGGVCVYRGVVIT